MRRFRRSRLFPLVIVFLVFLVYANALVNGFVYDDGALIVNNPFLGSWKYLGRIFTTTLFAGAGYASRYYRPLQLFTFLTDYSVWKLNPFGYHLTNIVLHALCALLVFFLLRRLLGNARVAFITAGLFAVHPINTQAVTYVSGRADPLGAGLMLASLLFYLAGRDPDGKKAGRWLAFSLATFALALLVKEIALILPLALLLLDVTFPVPAGKKGFFRRYLPFIVVAAIYLFIRQRVIAGVELPPSPGPPPLDIRLFTLPRIVLLYLGLLFLPLNLHIERDVSFSRSLLEPSVILPLAGLAVIVYFFIRSFRRERPVFFAGAWFFLFLFPSFNVIPLVAPVAEHWLYLPAIGLYLLAGLAVDRLLAGNRKSRSFVTMAALAVLFAFYSSLTVRRNRDWKDNFTFYRETLRHNPLSFRAHTGLGLVYRTAGRLDEAIAEYQTALQIKPDYPEARINLGSAYFQKGMFAEAAAAYTAALKLGQHRNEIYINLGNSYAAWGKPAEAIEIYRESLKLNPVQSEAHFRLGIVYHQQNLFTEAEAEYQKALALRPDYPAALNNLGCLYVEKKIDPGKGMLLIRRALTREPNNASFLDSLGWAYYLAGNRVEAKRYLEQAASRAPENPVIREHFQKAIGE